MTDFPQPDFLDKLGMEAAKDLAPLLYRTSPTG